MQTRGPARESGCIQPGDRIKCLNISFENITLQDACDILNCGSPYRMRLLLEKRVAPTSSNTKSDQSKLAASRAAAIQDQAIMFRQNLPPTINRKPLNNANLNQRQPERALTVSTSNGARFIETARHCVNRLTSLISGSHPPPRSANASNALEPYRDQFNTGYRVSSDQQMFEPMHHLGSAAARRQQFALAVNVNQLNSSHLNYGVEAERLNCATSERRRQTSDQLELDREFSGLSPINNNGSQSTNCANQSTTNSISSNQRYPVSMEDNNSTSNDFVLDGSLEQFNNKNANHRLHGPPLFSGAQLIQRQVAGKREALDLHNLATNEQINPLSDLTIKQVSSANGIGPRRQSAADVVGQQETRRQTKLQHLEQTQSQPEIAAHNGDDDLQDDNKSIAARSDADCSSVDLQSFAKGRPLDLSAGQALVGSVSTPTMNLLSTTTTSNKQSKLAADWQQISPRRNKKDQLQKQKKESSIREEPISDSSFGADSTCKLVESGKEEIGKNSSDLATNDDSRDSAMTTETTQFPSSTISSKNSTGTHITCLEPRINIKKSIQKLNMRAAAAESNTISEVKK